MIHIIFFLTMSFIHPALTVSSPVFENNGFIPSKYTCEGMDINPTIGISGAPKETVSLALIVDDPDAPKGTFDHWVTWNIPPTDLIKEKSSPGTEGKNGTGSSRYKGPCPPEGTHRYFFKVYALDTKLDLKSGSDKKSLEQAMEGHILAKGELIGLYKKVK